HLLFHSLHNSQRILFHPSLFARGLFFVSDLVWFSQESSINNESYPFFLLRSDYLFLDRDRERAQARNSGKGKQVKSDGLTPEQRRERDAKALQEKAARKAAQAAGGNNAVTYSRR
ncbi:hypothetical protein PIB30_087379, partial [Stylosanthes scabra]|nr:hypothetical protein [Stylosanthes scabra]